MRPRPKDWDDVASWWQDPFVPHEAAALASKARPCEKRSWSLALCPGTLPWRAAGWAGEAPGIGSHQRIIWELDADGCQHCTQTLVTKIKGARFTPCYSMFGGRDCPKQDARSQTSCKRLQSITVFSRLWLNVPQTSFSLKLFQSTCTYFYIYLSQDQELFEEKHGPMTAV